MISIREITQFIAAIERCDHTEEIEQTSGIDYSHVMQALIKYDLTMGLMCHQFDLDYTPQNTNELVSEVTHLLSENASLKSQLEHSDKAVGKSLRMLGDLQEIDCPFCEGTGSDKTNEEEISFCPACGGCKIITINDLRDYHTKGNKQS